MKKLLITLSLAAVAVACTPCKTPADYVNPFIGATTSVDAAGIYHGLGKTFPGATTPFGMVQANPTTMTGGDNAPGYSNELKTIEGFALTQMNGVGWFGDLGNFLTMPTTGETMYTIAGLENGSIEGWRSAYDKETETAAAGYYSVRLTDYDILAEMSATTHCGAMKFTFPENEVSRIQIDLARRVAGTAETEYIKVLDDHTITGWMHCTPDCGGWGDGDGQALYTVYFYTTFSKPISDYGFWSADIPEGTSRHKDDVVSLPYLQRVKNAVRVKGQDELEGKHIGFFTEFPTTAGEEVTVLTGISFVDMEGAKNNYEAEIAGKSFETVRKEAFDSWNKALEVVNIQGGTEDEKTIFYTALYHTMIDPRTYTDADGRYTGADGLIHEADSFTKRTIFSGWDVFRSQIPLQTIIHPEVVSDLINSLTTMATESGRKYYERWEFLNSYSGCMIGNPALSVIADAYAKGIRTFDAELALEYGKNTSDIIGNGPLGYTADGVGIGKTLEIGYGDWCLAEFAKALGNEELAAECYERGQAYRNIFNPENGWFGVRKADGSWYPWTEASFTQEGYGCFECGPFQQGWFVPQDVEGLTELLGGKEATLDLLNMFFDNTPLNFGWNCYYNHANEPVHLVPFMFNTLGQPENTQKWTRIICKNAYTNAVEGICGNEDCGQMSAWYVLAASGIHPSCPGNTVMEITSPVFDKITYKLNPDYAAGKTFTVVAINNSEENVYIQSAKLNGKDYNCSHIDFSDITNGGKLELTMGSEPSNWGK